MIARRQSKARSARRRLVPAMAAASLCATVLGTGPSQAGPITAGTPDCGGDAFSSAQVIENRPPRRGPLTAGPQTLCADLAPQQPPANVEIGVYPTFGPGRGGRGHGAPY